MKNLDDTIKDLDIYLSIPSRHFAPSDWHGNHKDSNARMYYTEEGSFPAIVNGKSYIVPEHHMLLLPPNVQHIYWGFPGHSLTLLRFDFCAFVEGEDIFMRLGLSDDHHLVPMDYEQVLAIFNNMRKPAAISHNLSIRMERYAQVAKLLTLYIDARLKIEVSATEFTAVIRYMEEHLTEDISNDTLAALMHFNTTYFISRFGQQLGMPPMKYFAQLRIAEATKLLAAESADLSTVSRAIGIDNVYYFKSFFKKHTGITPEEYKHAIHLPEHLPYIHDIHPY